jgi:hypothetical protein
MSATENNLLEINTQYAEAIKVIADKDTQIEDLRKENLRLQLLVNSIRFGSKSEKVAPAEDSGKQGSLFAATKLPEATRQQAQEEKKIEVPAHTRKARKRHADKDGNPTLVSR